MPENMKALGSELDDQLGTALPDPPLFCERGTMFNQNIPRILGVGTRIDHTLPPGTLEVWQDGKRIGRIENIGIR
jgi:hypothetical protein